VLKEKRKHRRDDREREVKGIGKERMERQIAR